MQQSQKNSHHHRRRRRKILFTSGLAAVGLAALLAQNNLPAPAIGSDGLPEQPTTSLSEPVKTLAPPPSEEEQPSEELVDPQQVKDALQGTADLKREISRLVKEFGRLPGAGAEARKLATILEEVKKYESAIKAAQKSGVGLRDAVQEYWDAQIWESVNESRRLIDVPRGISQISKDLKRLDSLLKGKTFQKLAIDQTALKNNVEAIRQALAEAKTAYENKDLEAAEDALQPIHDGMHPGEVMGVLYRFRDIASMSARIKDQEMRTAIDEVLGPVMEAVNEGDFREANAILNDSYDDLMRLMRLATQLGTSRKVNRNSLTDLIDKLEQRISDKAAQEQRPAE